MLRVVQSRRALLVVTAIVFAAGDLAHKALDPARFHHARTPFVALVMAGVVAALVTLVPRIPSSAAAIGAGIASGGALGNLVSLLAWAQGIPDPLVFADRVAFNLADLFALAGDALLLSAAVLYGLRHREALRQPV
jgi:lipoprotein signal peptidase